MPEIVRLFHASQIVHDVLEVGRFYHDFFGSWVYDAQHLETEGARNSSHLMGGTFALETLAPIDATAPSGVARFLRRHGPHFNNIAFWVRDCRGLAEQLLACGVRVAVRGGAFAEELPEGDFAYVITHPKDTHGIAFEFLEDQRIHDPRDQPWWSASYWSDRHPLGILSLSHCTIAVTDLDAAERFLATALLGEQVGSDDDPTRGTRSAFFAVADTLVELATPTSAHSPLGRHLASHGPILYAFTFAVRDLDAVRRHASDHGVGLISYGDHTVELDPDQTFGAVFGFSERILPGHPDMRP